uniref:Helix-hairpin-helix DNA-binding motif class 1 domain-containing protein n=1 Tax=Paenibacillus athensensis TaxID=1967502 RepID=A0A4Y8Q3V7_9BACL
MELLKRKGGIAACALMLAGVLAYVIWSFIFAGKAAMPAWETLNEPMKQLVAPEVEGKGLSQGERGEQQGPQRAEAPVASSGQTAEDGILRGSSGERGVAGGGGTAGAGEAVGAGGASGGGGTAGAGEAVGADEASGGGATAGSGGAARAGEASGAGGAAGQRGGGLPSVNGNGQSKAGPQELRVELNTATVEQLDTLPGIGASKAQAIAAYRKSAGPFRSVDDLLHVKGIGEKLLAKIRPYVYVAPH